MPHSSSGLKRVLVNLAAALGVAAAGYALSEPAEERRARIYPNVRHRRELEALRAQGWVEPFPAVMPAPTYWPAVFGVGITFIAGGLATQLLISAVGIVLATIGAIGWIYDLVQESAGDHEREGGRADEHTGQPSTGP